VCLFLHFHVLSKTPGYGRILEWPVQNMQQAGQVVVDLELAGARAEVSVSPHKSDVFL
jgi:hypothetical protein